jgi:hypothetical protein
MTSSAPFFTILCNRFEHMQSTTDAARVLSIQQVDQNLQAANIVDGLLVRLVLQVQITHCANGDDGRCLVADTEILDKFLDLPEISRDFI